MLLTLSPLNFKHVRLVFLPYIKNLSTKAAANLKMRINFPECPHFLLPPDMFFLRDPDTCRDFNYY
jgi:hypothetical protein